MGTEAKSEGKREEEKLTFDSNPQSHGESNEPEPCEPKRWGREDQDFLRPALVNIRTSTNLTRGR